MATMPEDVVKERMASIEAAAKERLGNAMPESTMEAPKEVPPAAPAIDLTNWTPPTTSSEGIKVEAPDPATVPVKSVRDADGTIKAYNKNGDLIVEYLKNGQVKEHSKRLFGIMDDAIETKTLPGFPAERKYREIMMKDGVLKIPIKTPEEIKKVDEEMKLASERFLGDRMNIKTLADMRKAEEQTKLYVERHKDADYYELLPKGTGEWALPNDLDNDKTKMHYRHYMRLGESLVRKVGEGIIDASNAKPEWTFDELMEMDAKHGFIPGISDRDLAIKAMTTYSNFKINHPDLYGMYSRVTDYRTRILENIEHVIGGLLSGLASAAFYSSDYKTGSITGNEGNWAEKVEKGVVNTMSKGAWAYGGYRAFKGVSSAAMSAFKSAGSRIGLFQKGVAGLGSKVAPVATAEEAMAAIASEEAAASSVAGRILNSGVVNYGKRMLKNSAEGAAFMGAESVINGDSENLGGSMAMGAGAGALLPVAISGAFKGGKMLGWGLKKTLGPMLTRIGYTTPYADVQRAYTTFDHSAATALSSVESFHAAADAAMPTLGNIASAMTGDQKLTFMKMILSKSNFISLNDQFNANVRSKTPKFTGNKTPEIVPIPDDYIPDLVENTYTGNKTLELAEPVKLKSEVKSFSSGEDMYQDFNKTDPIDTSKLSGVALRDAKLKQAASALGIPGRGQWLGEQLRLAGDKLPDDIDYELLNQFANRDLPILIADAGEMRFEQRLDVAQLSKLRAGNLSKSDLKSMKINNESEIPGRILDLEENIARRQRVHFGGGSDVEAMPTEQELGQLSTKDQGILTSNVKKNQFLNQQIEKLRKQYVSVMNDNWGKNEKGRFQKLESIKQKIQGHEEKLYGKKTALVSAADDPSATLVVVDESQIPTLINEDGNLVIPKGFTHSHDFSISQGTMDEMLVQNPESNPVILSIPFSSVKAVPGKTRMGRTILDADAQVKSGNFKVYRPRDAHNALIESIADEQIANIVAAGGKAPSRNNMINEVAFKVDRQMGTIEDLTKKWYDVAEKETVRGDMVRAAVEADGVALELKKHQEKLAKAFMTPNENVDVWIKKAGDAAEKYVDESMKYLDVGRESDKGIPDGLARVIEVIGGTVPEAQTLGVPKSVRDGVLSRMIKATQKWDTPSRRAEMSNRSFKSRMSKAEGKDVELDTFGDDMSDYSRSIDDKEEGFRLGGRSPQAQVNLRQDGSVVSDYSGQAPGAGEYSTRAEFAGVQKAKR